MLGRSLRPDPGLEQLQRWREWRICGMELSCPSDTQRQQIRASVLASCTVLITVQYVAQALLPYDVDYSACSRDKCCGQCGERGQLHLFPAGGPCAMSF